MARAERTHGSNFSLGYKPPLDGIRAVAVLAVMAYHVDVGFRSGDGWSLSAGYLGVDIFFVLSGFLITTILAEEWLRTRRIDLKAFYARRALRLFPAVIVVLISVWVYAGSVLNASAAHYVRREAIWTLLYVQNWHLIDVRPNLLVHLDHTWSLSVEEQFYFAWPLLLLGLFALAKSAWFRIGIILFAATASIVAMHVVTRTDPVRAFYGTDTRAQGLLLGAALGLAVVFGKVSRVSRQWAGSVGWGGVALLFLVFIAVDRQMSPTSGPITLASIGAAALVFGVVGAPDSVLARALSQKILVVIGRISYGLYLWHLPIFLVVTPRDTDFTLWNTGLSFWPLLVVRFALTFAVAGASFALIERPALRLKRRFERRPHHAVP